MNESTAAAPTRPSPSASDPADARFERLYREHVRTVANYVHRRTGDLHATEDIVSEVFLAALRTRGRYRERGIPPKFWLLRIATNAIRRWARSGRRPLQLVPDPDALLGGASDEEDSSADDELERARHAMRGLSQRQQEALALHYLEGLGVREVALVLECRVGTVKSTLSRGREALRRRLAEPRRTR